MGAASGDVRVHENPARICRGHEPRALRIHRRRLSEEELPPAVLGRHREQVDSMIFRPAYARAEEPSARISAVLAVHRDLLEETDRALGCPIRNLASELSDTHPAVRARVAALFDEWSCRIRDLQEEARGQLPPDLDPDELSRLVLTVMEGGVMQARAHRDLRGFDASVRQLRRYMDALSAAAGPEGE